MKRFLIVFAFILCLGLLSSFISEDPVVIDKTEAQKAFTMLNNIRTQPSNYYAEFPFLRSSEITNTKLVWNDTLASVAEAKSYDMATRNYYGHVDPKGYGMNFFIQKSGYQLNAQWTKNKAANNFESIAVNVKDGEEAIRNFIIDDGVPSLGHRMHLLGMGTWNASLTDIGIGFARRASGSTYTTYVTVVIAKHDW